MTIRQENLLKYFYFKLQDRPLHYDASAMLD